MFDDSMYWFMFLYLLLLVLLWAIGLLGSPAPHTIGW